MIFTQAGSSTRPEIWDTNDIQENGLPGVIFNISERITYTGYIQNGQVLFRLITPSRHSRDVLFDKSLFRACGS